AGGGRVAGSRAVREHHRTRGLRDARGRLRHPRVRSLPTRKTAGARPGAGRRESHRHSRREEFDGCSSPPDEVSCPPCGGWLQFYYFFRRALRLRRRTRTSTNWSAPALLRKRRTTSRPPRRILRTRTASFRTIRR